MLSLAALPPQGAIATPACEADVLGPDEGLFVAAAEAFARWAQRAAPGDTCIYARAVRLRARCDTSAAARRLHTSGALLLWQRRAADLRGRIGAGAPQIYEYHARRTDRPLIARAEWGAPDRAPSRHLGREHRRMFELLQQLAERQVACPTNKRLAEMLGLCSASRAGGIIVALRDAGLIDIIHLQRGDTHARSISIRKTIATTGWRDEVWA